MSFSRLWLKGLSKGWGWGGGGAQLILISFTIVAVPTVTHICLMKTTLYYKDYSAICSILYQCTERERKSFSS